MARSAGYRACVRWMPILLVAALVPAASSAPPEKPRLYAAVFNVRGSVVGGNRGSFGAFVRADLDTTWIRLSRSNLICFGLAYSGGGEQGRLYLAAGDGVHRSTDLGKSWRTLTAWQTEEILSVVPDPYDAAVLSAASPFGVFRTTDDGRSWTAWNRGLRKWYVHRLYPDRAEPRALFALGEDDLYRSGDSGWIPLGAPFAQPVALSQNPVQRRSMLVGTEEEGLWRTGDGGRTWHRVQELGDVAVYAIRHTADGRQVYAGGFGTGLWHSADGGAGWTRLPFAVECDAITAIYVDPDDGNHLMIGTHAAGMYESTDHGRHWTFAGLRGAMVKQIERYP